MRTRTDDLDDWAARLPMGVGPARLGPDGRSVLVGRVGDHRPEVLPLAEVVPLERVLEPTALPPASTPIAVVVSGLGGRGRRAVDTPATAQRIAAHAQAVVLVTDPDRLRAVAGLASRLADRGVRCWVSVDAETGYPRAAAVASGLGWGLTPS